MDWLAYCSAVERIFWGSIDDSSSCDWLRWLGWWARWVDEPSEYLGFGSFKYGMDLVSDVRGNFLGEKQDKTEEVLLRVDASPSTCISISWDKPRTAVEVTMAIWRTWSVNLEHVQLPWKREMGIKGTPKGAGDVSFRPTRTRPTLRRKHQPDVWTQPGNWSEERCR